jgi:hypothetical protein
MSAAEQSFVGATEFVAGLVRQDKSPDEIEVELYRYFVQQQWSQDDRQEVLAMLPNLISKLKDGKTASEAFVEAVLARSAEFTNTVGATEEDEPAPSISKQIGTGCISVLGAAAMGIGRGLVIGFFLAVAGIVLHRNQPTSQEFAKFIAKEGFVGPSVEGKDFQIATYYHVKGTYTGEERFYIGVFHSFIRLPEFHKTP